MADSQSFQIQLECRLVPVDAEEADVSGFINAGQVSIGGQQFAVFIGSFGGAAGVQGIAAQGIAAQGIAAQGIARQGIAAQGIAAQGIARQGIARQ